MPGLSQIRFRGSFSPFVQSRRHARFATRATEPISVRPATAAVRLERKHLPLLGSPIASVRVEPGRVLHTTSARAGFVSLVEVPPNDEDWCANLLWPERKCLLLAHAGTLFSVFVPDVRATELRPLARHIVYVVEAALRSEGLPTDAGSHDR